MKTKLLISIVGILLLFSCKSNKKKYNDSKKTDCSIFNDKYIEHIISNRTDSAFFYIDKAILCDPNDDFFKMEKIKLLIRNKHYSRAIFITEKLANKNDPNFKMLYGTLLLKENHSNADNILNESYNLLAEKTRNYNEVNSNLHFYKIGLDNYFKGQTYAVSMVEKFKENYSDEHNIQLADFIERLILSGATSI